jgi:hypothetical protein
VLVGMMLRRLVEVMLGMKVVAVRRMRMVRSLFMIPGLEMLGGFLMMRRGVPRMFRCFLMVIGRVLSHYQCSFQCRRVFASF